MHRDWFSRKFLKPFWKEACVMSLYNSGIDDQLIIERMDNRSNAVREYKRPPTGNSFDPHMKCNDAEQIVRQHAWFLFITFSNWFALLLKKTVVRESLSRHGINSTGYELSYVHVDMKNSRNALSLPRSHYCALPYKSKIQITNDAICI